MVGSIQNSVIGMQTASANIAKSANTIANPKTENPPINDLVDIKINANNFKSNALVLGVQKDLQEELFRALDIKV
jgi:hypothetical protein